MQRLGSLKHFARAAGAALFAAALAPTTGVAQPAPAPTEGKVKVEWLGHEFYRFTSPKGIVVVTSPWLGNPDGPVKVEDLKRTDFILSNNSHNDDLGNPLEVNAVSGAMVITPGPLGRWLVSKGLKEDQFRRAGVGDQFTLKGLKFKIGPSAHDNTLSTGADGGPAASFFVTFETGFTIFYNGHSTLLGDLPLYAGLYQPDLAILGLAGDPPEFAQVGKLMTTNNPKLKRIIPSHMRPDAPIIADGKKELEKYGLAGMMFVPELRKVYEY